MKKNPSRLKAALLGLLLGAVAYMDAPAAQAEGGCCLLPGDPRFCNPIANGGPPNATACANVGGQWFPGRFCPNLGAPACFPKETVPAVSEWGLGFLALLLGTGGLVLLRERKQRTTGQ